MTGRPCSSTQYGVTEPNGYPGTSSDIVESTPKLSCKNNRRADCAFSCMIHYMNPEPEENQRPTRIVRLSGLGGEAACLRRLRGQSVFRLPRRWPGRKASRA